MSYTFELSFTGLCIFTFGGADLVRPTEVDVLLVKARTGSGHGPDDHLPFLSYRPHDVVGHAKPDHELIPGPDGNQIARLDLTDEDLQIIAPGAPGVHPLRAVWRDRTRFTNLDPTPDLTDSSQEAWLDWVMALKRVNPEMDGPTPSLPGNGLTLMSGSGAKLVTSVVHLTSGILRAEGFRRSVAIDSNTELHEYLIYDFDGTAGKILGHAMAGSVVLSIGGLPSDKSVILKGTNVLVALRAPLRADDTVEPLIRASITNLPAAEGTPTATLGHFAHFYDLVKFTQSPPPPPPRLPVSRGSAITSTGVFCPPTTHTDAK